MLRQQLVREMFQQQICRAWQYITFTSMRLLIVLCNYTKCKAFQNAKSIH